MRAQDKLDPSQGRNRVSIPSWDKAAVPDVNGTADNDNADIHVTIERVEWIEERVGPDGTARQQKRSLRARKTAVRLNVRWLLAGLIAGGAIIYKPELAEPLLKLFKLMIRAG
jgi:hypothetical protein